MWKNLISEQNKQCYVQFRPYPPVRQTGSKLHNSKLNYNLNLVIMTDEESPAMVHCDIIL